MTYKKNWLTSLCNLIFALAMIMAFSYNTFLNFNESTPESIVVFILSVVLSAGAIILIIYLISFVTSIIKNRIKKKTASVIYYISWWAIFLIAILIRCGFLYYYTEWESIFIAIALTINICKIILVFYIAKVSFGKMGGIIALFIQGFIATEIISCQTLDYGTIAYLYVLFLILLYTIYFKRINSKKEKSSVIGILIALMIISISGGIGLAIYLDYQITIPVLLLTAVFIGMMFSGWKHALIVLFGTIITCVIMYFVTTLLGYEYEYLLNDEIIYRLNNITENIPENIYSYMDSAFKYNTPEIGRNFYIPLAGTINIDIFIISVVYIFTFITGIIMLFTKRNSLLCIMLFTTGYLYYDNKHSVITCALLMICYLLNIFYDKHKDNSFIINEASVIKTEPSNISNENHDTLKISVVKESVTENPVTENPVTEETIAEKNVTEETDSEETVVEETYIEETDIEETDTEETAIEETVAEETVSEETVSEEIGDSANLDKYIIDEVIPELPIPKAIISYDDETANKTHIYNIISNEKKNTTFNNDLWQKRKARIQNKKTN